MEGKDNLRETWVLFVAGPISKLGVGNNNYFLNTNKFQACRKIYISQKQNKKHDIMNPIIVKVIDVI